LGGGFSLHDGISRLWNPTPTTKPGWNYIVLGIAFLFEGYSCRVAHHELMARRRHGQNLWRVIRASKDATVFTVFLEDSGALIGIAIALIGIALGQILHNPYCDPSASVLIGLVLVAVAVLLANESRELLLGERAHLGQIQRVKAWQENCWVRISETLSSAARHNLFFRVSAFRHPRRRIEHSR
jgi:divalent metal cation (Fe/Co/Zn/Cd) transporter